MTETPGTTSGAYVSSARSEPDQPTAWVGWIVYAGVMMIMLGIFQAIEGFVALFDDKYFHVQNTQLVLHLNYTGWGFVHLSLAILAIFGGYALMAGRTWGRVYAVILAMTNATANLVFLSAYPVWSTIMITIDALVIWAVCVHGREIKPVDY
jgi:hypothetical protein